MKNKTRILSWLLLAVMLTSLLPAFSIAVSAEKTALDVKWNFGYVGSRTNQNKNTVMQGSTSWIYTDVITVPKAGTKISFSTTEYPTNAVSVFSTWKQSGGNWVFDETGATIMATAEHPWVGQTLNGKEMLYEYVTDKDNESIRICSKVSDPRPTVYSEYTGEKSTKKILEENEFTATLAASGKIEGIKWMCGYASSETNTHGSAKEVKLFSASASNSYAVSNLILIPKKGTEISYTITSSPNNAYNAFTRYKLSGGVYVYDVGFDATSSMVRDGNTFTYVTEKDNEVIRLCCRPNVSYTTVNIDPPVTVTWKQTDKKGTAASAATQKTEWPDAALRSPLTGATLQGTEVKVKWNRGYVGSQYHASKKFTIAASPSSTYSYTDVITVPKAGTTVYFFDQSFDGYDGKYASTSALVLSHWTKKGSVWTFDRNKTYLTGCDCPSADIDGYYRTYYYTTTEDNENIRLCVLSAPKYSNEAPIYAPVYFVESSDLKADIPSGGKNELASGSCTFASGEKTEFKYWLPYTADEGRQYPLVFDLSADGGIASLLASQGTKRAIAVSFSGDTDKALRLLDELIKGLPIRVSDILFVGGDEVMTHVNKYSKFRVCQALLYTGNGQISNDTYEAKALSSFASANEAATWLLDQCEQYFRALEGLTMYAIGDSYFGGSAIGQHLTWVNLMGNKYRMNFHNYGIGGNTVAECSGRGNNSPPMATRCSELPDGGDIYILEGGRNDRHYNVPFGDNDSTNIRTLTGAFNTMIAKIRKNNPDALIVLVTPWSHKNEKGYLGTNDDYADAIKKLADYYQNEKNDKKVVCLYAADTEFTGINMSDAKCRAKYSVTSSDVSHLNVDGMNMIEPKFEKWIAEQYMTLNNIEEPVETTEAPEATNPDTSEAPSTEPAPKRGCGSAMVALLPIALISLAGACVSKKRR